MAQNAPSSEGEGKGSKDGMTQEEKDKVDKTVDKAIKSTPGKK